MTGSLQIKNNKYYIVLNTYQNGKRKAKWISTGLSSKGNKRAAEQLLRQALHDYEKNKPSSNSLFSDIVKLWLANVKKKVDEVTYQGYELLAQKHVLPYFENNRLKLSKITIDVLQDFFDEKSRCGRLDGKGGLSPASLKLIKNIVYQSLNEAVKLGHISSNPCQFVTLPKQVEHKTKFYSTAQLKALLEAVKDDALCHLIHIAIMYGLRRSELLGLQWDSIDFEAGLLTVKHTVTKVTELVAKDKTKNASSHRSFPLSDEARSIFEKLKQDETENKMLCGKSYQQNSYIFKWPDGKPFTPDYVSKHFKLILKNSGLPHIRFHELRHSCASLLLNKGCTLKDVMEYMGHSDIKMTANIYGHLDTARKATLVNTIADDLY